MKKSMEYWVRQAELLLGEALPRPVPPPAPAQPAPAEGPPPERPRCVKCGGQPNLGRCGKDGRVESYCRKCAEEEYLASLTSEERALLRNV